MEDNQTTLLKIELKECRELLKLSMRSNNSFTDKIRARVLKHLDRLVDLEGSYTSSLEFYHSDR